MRNHALCRLLSECAMTSNRAGAAIRSALANGLSVVFKQQVGTLAGVKLFGHVLLDERLRGAIGGAVVCAFGADLNAHQDVRAVRWNGGDGGELRKEQDAVGARIGDAVKAL